MTRDSTATYLHLHQSHHADLIEDFTRPSTSALPAEDIYIPPHLQPLNPEDEDDVVPDQHAAFGIQRATQAKRDVNWRDFGLDELVRRAPGERMGETAIGVGGAGGVAGGAGAAGATGTRVAAQRDEPVRLALRRRHGAGTASTRPTASGAGTLQNTNGGAGNGLPR